MLHVLLPQCRWTIFLLGEIPRPRYIWIENNSHSAEIPLLPQRRENHNTAVSVGLRVQLGKLLTDFNNTGVREWTPR